MVDSIWQVLEIEPTDNLKVIKRAYAAKVKQCRPEDDAAGFQLLNQSYKQAQAWARHKLAQDAAEQQTQSESEQTLAPELEVKPSHKQEPVQELEQEHAQSPIDTEEARLVQLQRTEGEQLCEKLNEVLENKNQRNRVSSYQFLHQSEYILDIDFRWQLGLHVFYRMAEHNAANTGSKRKKYNKIAPQVLNNLDTLFNWSASEFYIRDSIEEKLCDSIFPHIGRTHIQPDEIEGLRGGAKVERSESDPHETTQVILSSPLKRLGGLFIDIFILGFFVFLTQWLVGDPTVKGLPILKTPAFLISFLIIYFTYFWLLDHYKGGTVGKLILGMRVVNNEFERLPLTHCFSRTLAFMVLSIGGKITMVINAVIGPRCMHDRLTKTLVINSRER